MQTCYNCGKEVDDNVLICPDCGALVKRYGKPVPVEPEPNDPAPQYPNAYPNAYDTPARPAARDTVRLDEKGKPHFKGSVCFWLIVCAAFAGYMLFGFGCILLVYHHQSFFLDTLRAFPEFSDMADLLELLLASVDASYSFYAITLALFACKLGSIIWFLISKRRLAFYVLSGVSALLFVMNLIFGGGIQALIYAIDPLLTYFMLRRFWSRLRP